MPVRSMRKRLTGQPTVPEGNPLRTRRQVLLRLMAAAPVAWLGTWLATVVDGLLLPRKARAAQSLVMKAPAAPWQVVEFSWTRDERTFPGIAVRLPDASGAPGALYTACRLCTHEGCTFGFERDHALVGQIVGVTLANPVFLCRCHLSVYDPLRAGAVVSGPAKRPPWRFDVREQGGEFEITGIEPGAGEIR